MILILALRYSFHKCTDKEKGVQSTNSKARYAFADSLFSPFVVIANKSRTLATPTLSSPFINDCFTILQPRDPMWVKFGLYVNICLVQSGKVSWKLQLMFAHEM